MQNTWRWGLALGNAPDARILRWGYQHVGILEPTQILKFALPPTPNLKFAFPPTPNPNASQWNIGCFGFQTQISRVGHVHFIFCSRFQLRWVPHFQWNMGLSLSSLYFLIIYGYLWQKKSIKLISIHSFYDFRPFRILHTSLNVEYSDHSVLHV